MNWTTLDQSLRFRYPWTTSLHHHTGHCSLKAYLWQKLWELFLLSSSPNSHESKYAFHIITPPSMQASFSNQTSKSSNVTWQLNHVPVFRHFRRNDVSSWEQPPPQALALQQVFSSPLFQSHRWPPSSLRQSQPSIRCICVLQFEWPASSPIKVRNHTRILKHVWELTSEEQMQQVGYANSTEDENAEPVWWSSKKHWSRRSFFKPTRYSNGSKLADLVKPWFEAWCHYLVSFVS